MLAALVGVLYFSAAKLGSLTLMAEGTAIIWLPNGILLGFLLRFPERTVPIVMAAVAAELAADYPAFGMTEAVAIAVINVGEVLLARALLARWQFRSTFPELADVLRFLVIAPGVAAVVAAACGGAVYAVFRGGQTPYLEFVRLWWFGDAVGLILATPLVLAVRRSGVAGRITRADLVVGGAAVLCVVLLAVTVDGQLAGVHFGPIVLLPHGAASFATIKRIGIPWKTTSRKTPTPGSRTAFARSALPVCPPLDQRRTGATRRRRAASGSASKTSAGPARSPPPRQSPTAPRSSSAPVRRTNRARPGPSASR